MNPALAYVKIPAGEALKLLQEMLDDPRHRYLDGVTPAPIQIGEVFGRIVGHRQVTDAYLAWYATYHGAKFLTLDAKLRNLPGVVLLT